MNGRPLTFTEWVIKNHPDPDHAAVDYDQMVLCAVQYAQYRIKHIESLKEEIAQEIFEGEHLGEPHLSTAGKIIELLKKKL